MASGWRILIALLAIFVVSRAQDDNGVADVYPCNDLSRENYTCAGCIQSHPSCAWCTKDGFDDSGKYSRCDNYQKLESYGCSLDQIMFPESVLSKIRDEHLTETSMVTEESFPVQMKPQEIRLVMRPKDRKSFTLKYRQALDYPVDLYYVMDVSQSMKDDKEKLTELGDLLAKRMKQITRNFRLGFGSFVDKALMPFVDPRKEKQDRPCTECVAPYGFQHQMKLSTETEKFKTQVNLTRISGNLDSPEGGFDALMQAMVCKDEIGWRDKSRKMIVFSSDAGFHYAGDGRLAGVIKPNDGECHMEYNEENKYEYTESKNQDYPSIALIHETAKKYSANLIFAVTEEQESRYKLLLSALPDVSATVGVLAQDSGNIVTLIENEYNKISQKIIMTDDSPEEIKVTYRTRCKGGSDTPLNNTNICDNIKVGDEVEFEVTLEALKCTENRKHTINIQPSGIDEILQVKVTILCSCDCAAEERVVENSPKCNHEGDMVCGICECTGTAVGRNCECSAPGYSTTELDNKCKRTNDSQICEGRGTCDCGTCRCNERPGGERISGKFCECDNFNCPRHNRKICSENGECQCSKCICQPGYAGRACECPESQATCMSTNGLLCNGKGSCVCGVCVCNTDEEGIRYSGPTCEVCPTCPTKCEELRACVMCQAFETGPLNKTECDKCTFQGIIVDELPEVGNTSHTPCQFVDPSDDCTFYFQYEQIAGSDNVTVWMLPREKKDCPPAVPVLAIVLGVIAGIVLIGLLLLLVWKLLTVLHDQREFAKFEKDRLNARWDTVRLSAGGPGVGDSVGSDSGDRAHRSPAASSLETSHRPP